MRRRIDRRYRKLAGRELRAEFAAYRHILAS
jgi:hypothetical protein